MSQIEHVTPPTRLHIQEGISYGSLKNNSLEKNCFQFHSSKMFLKKPLNIATKKQGKENTSKVKR